MNETIMEMISGLTFLGYYDPSKGMVVVHFFNKDEEDKNDVIAYLKGDMSWDLREVVSETGVLMDEYESITIKHKLLGCFAKDSDLDKLIRSGTTKMAKEKHPDVDLEEVDKMFLIFNRNAYDN